MTLIRQEDMDKIMPFLKEHGHEIGKRGTEEKCKVSQKIMQYYTMLSALPDGMTFCLLEHEIENYKKKYEVK